MIILQIILFVLTWVTVSLWLGARFRLSAAAHPAIITASLFCLLVLCGSAGVLRVGAWGATWAGAVLLPLMLCRDRRKLRTGWERIWRVQLLFWLFAGGVFAIFFFCLRDIGIQESAYFRAWGFVPKSMLETGSFYREFADALALPVYAPGGGMIDFYFAFLAGGSADWITVFSAFFVCLAMGFALTAAFAPRRGVMTPLIAVVALGICFLTPEGGDAWAWCLSLIAWCVIIGWVIFGDARRGRIILAHLFAGALLLGFMQLADFSTATHRVMGFVAAAILALYFFSLRGRGAGMLLFLLPPSLFLALSGRCGALLLGIVLAVCLVDRICTTWRTRGGGKALTSSAVLALIIALSLGAVGAWDGGVERLKNTQIDTFHVDFDSAAKVICGDDELTKNQQTQRVGMLEAYKDRRIASTAMNTPDLAEIINDLTEGKRRSFDTLWSVFIIVSVMAIGTLGVLLGLRRYREIVPFALAALIVLLGSGVYYGYMIGIFQQTYPATAFRPNWVYNIQNIVLVMVIGVAVPYLLMLRSQSRNEVFAAAAGIGAIFLVLAPAVAPLQFANIPARMVYEEIRSHLPGGRILLVSDDPTQGRSVADFCALNGDDDKWENKWRSNAEIADPLSFDRTVLIITAKNAIAEQFTNWGVPRDLLKDPRGIIAIQAEARDGKLRLLSLSYGSVQTRLARVFTDGDDDRRYSLDFETTATGNRRVVSAITVTEADFD